MTSLRARLFGIWLLSMVAAVVVGTRLWQLSAESNAALRGRAEDLLEQACGQLSDRYSFYVTGWNGPPQGQADTRLAGDLTTLARLALAPLPGVQGGVLRDPQQIEPATAQSRIAALAVAEQATTIDQSTHDGRSTVLLACPLPGPIPNMAACVATDIDTAPDNPRLRVGGAVLLALMLTISGALIWLVTSMSRRVRKVQAALARHSPDGLPHVPLTGETLIDQIIEALNEAGERLRLAQHETSEAHARAAAAQRLAALGRVAAGVAHEVRNPIAAMRLRAEGALALDPGLDAARAGLRARTALEAILRQIDRLERLSTELLTMTQPRQPNRQSVDLRAFLTLLQVDWPGIAITCEGVDQAAFDPDLTRRILDNLLDNAARHSKQGSIIRVQVWMQARMLEIRVIDDGPGVPASLQASLFEPFVTGRADGTGLGLAIARELAQAQGGTLALEPLEAGACFVLRLPQEG